ncbi:MAG: hypothetical protein JWM57_3134 [Phycisphaerales bacterium]|nr:hypothetical protein [Phycisphaerales bacterium]
MQGFKTRRLAALSAGLISLAAVSTTQAAFSFVDTFGAGSVLNPASYPAATASSAGYTVASTKGATSSIASGDLKLAMGATTSGFVETQARFASTPAALATAGDFIELKVTFTNTSNILAGGAASGIYMGLYNSGSSDPISGLQSSGLTATAGSAFATGNAANWQGYNSRVLGATGSNQVFTRPVQSGAGTTSANQDLLGNAAGGGLYTNPAGVQVGAGSTSAAALTNGSVYTSDLLITLNGDGTASIVSSLYAGVGTGGAQLATQTVTAATPLLTTSFDGLALGYRQSGTSVATQIDYNSISVTAGAAATPEPASLALLALGGTAMLRRRRA